MTLEDRIKHYLRTHPGWVSGMEIESRAYEWQSKRIGRTLREMSADKIENGKLVKEASLEKSYTQDKHHAVRYRLKAPPSIAQVQEAINLIKERQGVLL